MHVRSSETDKVKIISARGIHEMYNVQEHRPGKFVFNADSPPQ